MTRKKNLEDIYYPVPQESCMVATGKPSVNQNVIKLIIRNTLKGAYRLKEPSRSYYEKPKKPMAVATQDQIDMVIHLIESLQPADAIEAALASQFAITYIRGLDGAQGEYIKYSTIIDFFDFGHKVLGALQKYRSKGMQQINVQYNVNQGQVVNIKHTEQVL